ncbi:hypothetical protein TTHERM_01300740 (macronuclear) [Tetrahymena thermophila SB210]|uniref:Uncharacterized protein n=1 Tax=Tetrahymena thermophila (strain SB210) TaxID=312017 RepID=Q24BA2_TETTS|nr:hypothetical protein TTHERM_01300740 [Tetrahymena thermophila SB210]EAS05069.2 hypothetical protein TTHERM_01300740 [Tetrahymena thermophila SB210]|eukprot:XP_001025314.2 hypothetical protein TTHERM_01300740 [Tetrahymena thermophila SB210]
MFELDQLVQPFRKLVLSIAKIETLSSQIPTLFKLDIQHDNFDMSETSKLKEIPYGNTLNQLKPCIPKIISGIFQNYLKEKSTQEEVGGGQTLRIVQNTNANPVYQV